MDATTWMMAMVMAVAMAMVTVVTVVPETLKVRKDSDWPRRGRSSTF
jgi:hypothetical protein